LEESGFKIKKVGEITMIVVASPQYIKSNKRIKRPEDLVDHNCFTYGSLSFRSKWALQSKDEKVNVKVNASVVTNHMSSLLQMSLDGSGVSFVPDFICKDLVKSKQLINILPGWKSAGFPVSMILPLGTHSSARLKITSQLLSKELERAFATQGI
jgi:DNA-binding transcriptional LysR family regulator